VEKGFLGLFSTQAAEEVSDVSIVHHVLAAKEYRYVNGRHIRLVKWSVMGHLRARDVLFDGMVHNSRVEKLV
jgi:hypothetical protein